MLLVLGVMGMGCDTVGTAPEKTAPTLAGPAWQLAGFETVTGETVGPGAEPIRVQFGVDQRFDGASATNSFGGRYLVEPDQQLVIDSLRTTLAGLPDGSKYLTFYSALRNVGTYQITDGTLRISYGTDGAAMLLERRDAQP